MKLRKLGILSLIAHALTAVFSLTGTWALYNLKNVPDWDYSALTFWLGIANIVTGVLTAFLLMAHHEGWFSAWTLLVLCTVLAGGMELLGTTTGIPFGAYQYTDLLGPKFLGHVPYLIPPSWMMMLYPAMVLTHALQVHPVVRPVVAGFVLTVWDFAMDPAVTTGFAYWLWETDGAFYGMPLQNWLGWWFTGALVAAAFYGVHKKWKGTWDWATLALYLIQGAFMAGLAWIYMRPTATVLWAASVAALLALVRWRTRKPVISGAMQWRTLSS